MREPVLEVVSAGPRTTELRVNAALDQLPIVQAAARTLTGGRGFALKEIAEVTHAIDEVGAMLTNCGVDRVPTALFVRRLGLSLSHDEYGHLAPMPSAAPRFEMEGARGVDRSRADHRPSGGVGGGVRNRGRVHHTTAWVHLRRPPSAADTPHSGLPFPARGVGHR